MTRVEARQAIREAAAGQRRRTNLRMASAMQRRGRRANLLPLPKLEQAVRIVRQHRLVPNDVLKVAGFRPYPEADAEVPS